MYMKRLPLLLLLFALMGVSCSKNDNGPVEIFVEPFGGSEKLAVDGATATWSNGDVLRLNSGTAVVERKDNGHAYISNALIGDVNRALFPASLHEGFLSSDQVTVTLPQEYHYRTSGGTQLLDIPMAARSTDQLQLHFRHLTGAIAVKIKNTRSHALVIDHITITSSGYQLSGSRELNFAHIDTIGPIATSDEAKRKIVMYFDIEELSLASGASKTVLLPVPPVGDDNKFTVVVSGHNQGERYNYSKTQNTANSLSRNVIGFAAAVLSSGDATRCLFDGNGSSADNPYRIKTASDFKIMADAISNQWTYSGSYSGKCYRIESDIDMSGIEIDAIRHYSTGTFDGNGHTVSNLSVRSVAIDPYYTYCGLFATLSGGCTVKELTLANVTLQHSGNYDYDYLGALCGRMMGSCTLQNCGVSGLTILANATTNNTVCIGGIVGFCGIATTISGCSVVGTMDVTTTNCNIVHCGGIVGHFYLANKTLTMSSCTWNGTISVNTNNKTLYVGGLVGGLRYNETLTASNCQANGTISATAIASSKLGKYVGYANASQATVTLSSCSGTVTLKLNGVEQTVKDVGNR